MHNSLAVHRNSWTLNVVIKTSLVITLTPSTPSPHTPTSLSRIVYENRYKTHPLSIFNSYLFNRTKIVPIYAHESSKPTSFIKRRIEYSTKALLARFSKIIMLFKFLFEKVSLRFENYYIHEIEHSWSVNTNKTGSILAIYCV